MTTSNSRPSGPSGITRRQFAGGVAAASLPMLAGCTSLTDHEFSASGSVFMAPDLAEMLGYEEVLRDALHHVVGSDFFRIVNLSIDVTTQYAVYVSQLLDEASEGDGSGDNPIRPVVSGFITPKAMVYREARNPLAVLREPHILQRDESRWFLEASGVRGTENPWIRAPRLSNSERTDVFGGVDNRLRGYGGVIEADGVPTVVFAHLTKLETDDDVIFGMAFRQWEIEDTERDLIGEDGYLTNEEWAAEIDAAKEAINALRYE